MRHIWIPTRLSVININELYFFVNLPIHFHFLTNSRINNRHSHKRIFFVSNLQAQANVVNTNNKEAGHGNTKAKRYIRKLQHALVWFLFCSLFPYLWWYYRFEKIFRVLWKYFRCNKSFGWQPMNIVVHGSFTRHTSKVNLPSRLHIMQAGLIICYDSFSNVQYVRICQNKLLSHYAADFSSFTCIKWLFFYCS